ncbi:hypothetical protein HT094_11900 [Shewanella sp. ZOR0012]|uniref:hypothetical protein n=1 Tax=Shewanella sp. ZOR0012 TaxID=1339231 RepID=UPI00068C529E|nr:hypothetical protein [Shewanella sp. ZOR0012]NSM24964.1 hypothetical protein [Shewanella sp. ZOR0012]
MQWMAIEALYRKSRTTQSHQEHRVYPYLLRGMNVCRPNQVWAMDITYIPMTSGFVYLAAFIDCFPVASCLRNYQPPLMFISA